MSPHPCVNEEYTLQLIFFIDYWTSVHYNVCERCHCLLDRAVTFDCDNSGTLAIIHNSCCCHNETFQTYFYFPLLGFPASNVLTRAVTACCRRVWDCCVCFRSPSDTGGILTMPLSRKARHILIRMLCYIAFRIVCKN